MDNRQIKDLMTYMRRTGTQRLRIKNGDFEVEIERPAGKVLVQAVAEEASDCVVAESRPAMAMGRAPDSASVAPEADHNSIYVKSPIVGVFYPAPAPDEPPFVKTGDRVNPDTVVCIVEAMKVMNEVKAGVSGVVEEVLVDRGHPVEFGTKLIRISS